MMRLAGLLVIAALLILLGLAKLLGVFYLLWRGSAMPTLFGFKQVAYGIILIVAGASVLIATRRSSA
jgi:hypothetical protein